MVPGGAGLPLLADAGEKFVPAAVISAIWGGLEMAEKDTGPVRHKDALESNETQTRGIACRVMGCSGSDALVIPVLSGGM